MFHPEKHIRELISRFLEKKCTDQEIGQLTEWIFESPSHREYFDKINESYQAQTVLDHFTPEKIDEAWHRFSQRIEKEGKQKRSHTIVNRHYYNFLRIAASVSLLIIGTVVLWRSFFDTFHTTEKIVVYNPQSRNTNILLPDSTRVWLNTNSTIEYAHDFGIKDRQVILKGEAFFDVRKKANQNFIVRTGQLTVKVKGTRFNVRAYQGEDIKTTLEEGNVELCLQDNGKIYSLAPGDQITIRSHQKLITVEKVNTSNFTAWKEEQLVFDNTPLAEIILKLENKYQVKIAIDSSLALRERLTMTIGQESIDDILEMIQLSSQLNFKKENGQIIIYE